MLPSQRSESLNAISNSLAGLNLGSNVSSNQDADNQRRVHVKNRLRHSKTSDSLFSNKGGIFSGAQSSKPIFAGGVKKHARHNFSFSNARYHEIQRENRRLLGEILKKTTALPAGVRQRPIRPSSASFSPKFTTKNLRRVSAPNTNAVSFLVRQKERQRIEWENLALHRRLQSIRTGSSSSISNSHSIRTDGPKMRRSLSVPRFASHEQLNEESNDSILDESLSSFEI